MFHKKQNDYLSSLIAIFQIFLVFFTLSCGSSKKYDPNSHFIEKYGRKIDKIKVARKEPELLKKQIFYSRSPSKAEVIKMYNNKLYNNYRYLDVNEYSSVDEDIAAQIISSNQVDPRVFEVAYFTKNHGPFNNKDDLFSSINIPSKDAYGINTKFSDKSYLLVGDKSLQQNIDKISNSKTIQDITNSKKLIKERIELRRKQKMDRIFGDT